MSEQKYVNVLMTDGGMDFDLGTQPIMTDNRQSIGQDVMHSILESGIARELSAERNKAKRDYVLTRIEMLVEEDERIVAGSATATEMGTSTKSDLLILLTADTEEFGPVTLEIEA